jgi:hypothetical protein
VVDEIEKLLQIKVHHPLITVLGRNPWLEEWNVGSHQRLEHLPHRLLNHPVNHAGDGGIKLHLLQP